MLNAVQPGSYVRPHRHARPPKAECFVVLRGRAAFFIFADDGTVKQCHVLAPDAEHFGVDVEPGVYHGFAALEADTVIFEAKTGPYEAANDKEFAPWAPEEDTPEAEAYLAELLKKA
jgi:cupin fold WbuC family metalloprotein